MGVPWVVQRLGLSLFTALACSIPGRETKILPALWHGGKQADETPTLLGKNAQRNVCRGTNRTHGE